ncbi:MAG: universal stress protein [Bacteroidales bacterium]|jgi:nucleotide-binding universal stress UspA family protein/DNA-binding protein|nr:universal stress protein [Bacteroidales bacterium]
MKKILVPVDFSENTNNAVKAACDLSRALNCDIILFYSYFEMILMQSINITSSMESVPIIDPDITNILHERNEKEMKKWVSFIKSEYPNISVEAIVSPVELKEKIIEICENEDILMIVMSATGTGKKDSFSGSAASSLFDSTPAPIIAIPENYVYQDDALFRNILYATDFSDVAQDEIQFISDHFLGNVNRLYCCHLSFRGKEISEAVVKMEDLKNAFLAEEEIGKIVFKIIETNDVEEALEELTDDKEIGLISFHEHDRNIFYRFFHRSVIKKNIYRFNIPLLVFRKFES